MYKVLVGGIMICDSRVEELALINPVVNPEEGKAGSFSFIIPPEHPYYNLIQRRKSVVQVWQDADTEPLFSGMCMEVTEDFYRQKKIYCEGELTYLNDSIQRPAKHQGKTVRGLLETYVANHNAQVEEEKRFRVGMVTVTDPNDYIYCYTNMDSTMKCLKEDLVDDLGGFFRVRHENGVKYLDYLAESQSTCAQVIKLGKNLIDFTSNINSAEIATAIIPLGAKQEESSIEGLETRLTIESVNGGKDYVFSQDAVNSYGWIYSVVEWDNVTTPSALKTKGEKYLSDIQFENIVINAKAIDLHFADSSVERFKISDQIRVLSKAHGMDRYFRLTKMTINLNNPEKNTITLGKEEKLSLTAKNNQANAEIKKAIEAISPNAIMKEAVTNATQILKNAMNGYVTTVLNNDGTPKELLIMDTPSTETATKVWRWNINGLGYSKTGYNGEYGLAMTMNGAIVADFITAGTMYADRIKGGTLKLGGLNNESGVAEILDKDKKVLIRLDSNGITLAENVRISWNNISNQPNITQITKDTVTTEFIKGLNLAVGNEIKMGENATISWEKVKNQPNITQITKDTVTTEFVNALKVRAGSVAAEDIAGNTISGKTIDGGKIQQYGSSNTVLVIENAEIIGEYAGEGKNSIDFSNRVDGISGMAFCGENLLQIRTPNLYVGTASEPEYVYKAYTGAFAAGGYTLTFKNGILVGVT